MYYTIMMLQVESVRELVSGIDVTHIAMLRLVAELLTMVSRCGLRSSVVARVYDILHVLLIDRLCHSVMRIR